MAESGHISWPQSDPVWEFNYRLADTPSQEGIAITQAYYLGQKVFSKASLPVLRVEYDQNPPCENTGPYKDPLHYDNAEAKRSNNKVARYQYSSGGLRHLAVESFHANHGSLGNYRLVHRWIFREDGRVYPRIYSAGLQCKDDHRHHPYWRFDFDIDGERDDLTLEYNTYTGNNGYGQGWHTKSPEIRRRRNESSRRSWATIDKQTGRGYHILPGSDDGHADDFSQWDLWVLRYHASEDRNGNQGSARNDGLDAYVDGETLDGRDNVVWYAAHIEHLASEGPDIWHSGGPTLIPFGYSEPKKGKYKLGGRVAGWQGRAPKEIEGESNPTLTLAPGQTYEVTWENLDGAPHNIAILDGNGNVVKRTDIISEEGATQTLTFTASKGMETYLCQVHPTSMRGDIRASSDEVDLPDGGDGGRQGTSTFEVLSTTADAEFTYQFSVDGDVAKSAARDNRADPSDQISRNDDGTMTVTGMTGDKEGDVYAITGEILAFEKTGGESGIRLLLDGKEATDQLTGGSDRGPLVFEIISTEKGEISYRVVVRGTVEKTRVSEKIVSQDNDEISKKKDGRVVIDGYTGNPGYGDAFEITGKIISFERTGGDADVRLELDGEDITNQYLAEG